LHGRTFREQAIICSDGGASNAFLFLAFQNAPRSLSILFKQKPPSSANQLDKMRHFVELPMRLRQYSSFGVGLRKECSCCKMAGW
jgi:hypothetical protein